MSATIKELQRLAEAKCKSSGIDPKMMKKLRITTHTAKQVGEMSENFHAAGGMKIPYWTLSGKPTAFYRLRYLEQLPGFLANAEKPQRYTQPTGTLNEVYVAPLIDWVPIAKAATSRLAVTEGELKGISGCAHGRPTLALGGVDVWRSSARGLDFLPMLNQFVWAQREVDIIFDSDAADNTHVVRAQLSLARALSERGALVRIVRLPEGQGGAKQGLDDFLVAHGVEALDEVIAEAEPFSESFALWDMNREVVYIRDPGIIVVRENGKKMLPNAFVSHAYANHHYDEPQPNGGSKRRATAARWVEWEQRAELEAITYRPGATRIVDAQWNTWRGLAVAPKRGKVELWRKLLDHIFEHDGLAARKWFEQWCAYPLQHPGTKLFTSTLVWGRVHGTGKSLIGYTLMKIYGDNAAEIRNKDLHGSFNEWVQDKQFVMADEITGSDKRVDADELKTIITRPSVRINAKFMPSYVVPDCVNYYFTSNHPDAAFLDDTDRRQFVAEVAGDKLPDSFYAAYDKWYKRPDGTPMGAPGEGCAAVLYHLLSLDLTGFNPFSAAPDTPAKMEMITASKSEHAAWCQQLAEDPDTALKPLNKTGKPCGSDLFTATQLFEAFDPRNNGRVKPVGLGRELKRAGFRLVNEGRTVRTSQGCSRLYAIRNVAKWMRAKPAECGAHWDSFFGPKARKY